MRTVAVMSRKGGCGKTTVAHLLCVGAVWHKRAAALLHTDDRLPIGNVKRPYGYYDCRDRDVLGSTVDRLTKDSAKPGLVVIDSGGNRPKHDRLIASNVDLVIIPLMLTGEDIAVAVAHAAELQDTGTDIRFLLNRLPAKSRLSSYDQDLLDRIDPAKVLGHLGEVRASRILLDVDPVSGMPTPPTPVNNAARALLRDLLTVVNL